MYTFYISIALYVYIYVYIYGQSRWLSRRCAGWCLGWPAIRETGHTHNTHDKNTTTNDHTKNFPVHLTMIEGGETYGAYHPPRIDGWKI